MADADPFDDEEFQDRLGKLLAMMGSTQQGEADTARRKLIEHLAHRRLRPTDLADRLRRPPPPRAARPQRPPESSVWREGDLAHDLDVARHARQAAEEMAQGMLGENIALRRRLSLAEREVQVLSVRRGVSTIVAIAASLFAILMALVVGAEHIDVLFPETPLKTVVMHPTMGSLFGASTNVHPAMHLNGAPPATSVQPEGAGERLGYVVADRLALRDEAGGDTRVRTYLGRGTPVVIVQDLVLDGQPWSLIRTDSGTGYADAASIGLAQ